MHATAESSVALMEGMKLLCARVGQIQLQSGDLRASHVYLSVICMHFASDLFVASCDGLRLGTLGISALLIPYTCTMTKSKDNLLFACDLGF
jgi:hypothetical protein